MTAEAPGLASPQVLREYALLADGERGALVGPHGDCVWMCAPRWDSDAVFAALVGGGGAFRITPTDRFVWGGAYEDGSLIWGVRWVTDHGVVECRDALAFPGDPHRAVFLRRVTAAVGAAEVAVTVAPAVDFGRVPVVLRAAAAQTWTGAEHGLRWRLSGSAAAALTPGAAGLAATLHIAEGQHLDLVLELADAQLPTEIPSADQAWAATEAAWRRSVPGLTHSLTPRDARQAYAVLRGLTSQGGGMVAAATLGLPEHAEARRNYDYRYSWIRDQCYAGLAVAADGPHPVLDSAVGFVTARLLADGPDLKPAYTIAGDPVPDERHLRLAGYPGGQDIAGNHANQQFQLDAFGEILQLLAAAAGHDRLDADHRRAAAVAVDAVRRRWTDPDAGIWELDDHPWTHSRLTCVAGLRAVAAAAIVPDPEGCTALAEQILTDTTARARHADGHWTRAPDDARLDAALLLPPLRGAVPADDPRTRATLAVVERELGRDGYLYRFRHDDRPLGRAEGAFLLCGFLMAMAHHQQGDRVAAARWFERNRAACGPPGLFTEEYDVRERQLRGNLPQAFVHAMLLEASLRLAD